jgi:hypothetical protein
LIRGATLIGVINIDDGGSWGRRLHSRRWHSFGVSDTLLAHLFFFIEVIEDDDFAVIGSPKNSAIEVTKKSPGELLIP